MGDAQVKLGKPKQEHSVKRNGESPGLCLSFVWWRVRAFGFVRRGIRQRGGGLSRAARKIQSHMNPHTMQVCASCHSMYGRSATQIQRKIDSIGTCGTRVYVSR